MTTPKNDKKNPDGALTSYHFDVGNSNVGPLGFSARVQATSKEQALERLRNYLSFHHADGIKVFDDVEDEGPAPSVGIEYLRIYINANNVAITDIDFADELPD